MASKVAAIVSAVAASEVELPIAIAVAVGVGIGVGFWIGYDWYQKRRKTCG